MKTTYAVYQGCQQTGLALEQALAAIRTYGDRNQACHSPINDLVAEGRLTDIATTIADDLRDLASTMPIELQDDEADFRAIILELRDEWFTIDNPSGLADGLAKPWMWQPKPQLVQRFKDSQTPEKKEVARRANEDQVAKGAARRLQRHNEEKELVEQLSTELEDNTVPTPGPTSSKKKRNASQEVSVHERKKAWTTIQSLQRRARASYRASLELQREVNRVVSHYKDQYGTSPPPEG